MSDATVIEFLLGLVVTVCLSMAGWALKRASRVDELQLQFDAIEKHQDATDVTISMWQTQRAEQDARVYALHSDVVVLRTQLNGVNGGNGLNGDFKNTRARVDQLAADLETVKRALLRLQVHQEDTERA